MDHSNNQSVILISGFGRDLITAISLIFLLLVEYQGAAKVSTIMIGQQAIMDAYLCLLHLTAGILVGKCLVSLFLLLLLFHHMHRSSSSDS